MTEQRSLIADIEGYCRRTGMAESTFGRRAVNDGKFVGRLREGRRVTAPTVAKVHAFLAAQRRPARRRPDPKSNPIPAPGTRTPTAQKGGVGAADERRAESSARVFRFYDNRQKYLLFVNTCSEKWVVAERVSAELAHIQLRPPALRVFDAGMGDGTVLTRVMRHMHRRFPAVPFYITGKEISLEDVRLSLEKLPDRFFEHPATVFVVTNLYYTEAPWLMPGSLAAAASLNWHEVPLAGTSADEFDEQIKALQPVLSHGWEARASATTGNPLYIRPSVLVLYREDHRVMLDHTIPRPGRVPGQYDLVIASQPYRARMPIEFKVRKVLAPLARSLAAGGRMLTVQSYGRDPGLEIIHRIWPGEDPFQHDRHRMLKAMKVELGQTERDLNFNAYADRRALFRYEMHTLPSEIGDSIGTSTLFAAWNAAIYVAQIEDERLGDAIASTAYLDATREVLQKHGGLWFQDESFVVTRRRA